MIVNYDKEIDMVYISKQINNQWIQVGLNRDEVHQIIHSHPYNPQAGRISKAAVAGAPPLAIHDKLIRKDERLKVLDELWDFCLVNGAVEDGDLVGIPSDPFFSLKLVKKIAKMRNALEEI